MTKQTKHIQSLKYYLKSMTDDVEREAFAAKCDTTFGHLKQVYYCNRKCDAGLAIEIEKHSNREVLCEELRPDVDFNYLRTPITEEA